MTIPFETGDIVLLAPAVGQGSLFQRAIQTTGSVSTHNELIILDADGAAWVGCAHPPHFELVPFHDRIAACASGKSNMLVVRHRHWMCGAATPEQRWRWQENVRASVRTMAILKVPYDRIAISTFGRNVVRAKLPKFMRQLVKQVEHHVYCTEACDLTHRACWPYLDIFRQIPKQDMYAPIHIERVLLSEHSDLIPIADWGLAARLGIEMPGA